MYFTAEFDNVTNEHFQIYKYIQKHIVKLKILNFSFHMCKSMTLSVEDPIKW